MDIKHWAFLISNDTNKQEFTNKLLSRKATSELEYLNPLQGMLFSNATIIDFLDQENRHGFTVLTPNLDRSFQSMSSGEQKRKLLDYIINKKPDYLILENPFDNLDAETQFFVLEKITEISSHTSIIQIITRERDILPFITNRGIIGQENEIVILRNSDSFLDTYKNRKTITFSKPIPPPITRFNIAQNELVVCNKINVSYNEKPILKNITWTIRKNEFWHLIGPNGSGKTTLLSMITGDNPKGYGQDLTLFGVKKGSGESIWSIKNNIGYFSSAMTNFFSRSHTLEQMLISGFFDSIGLYNTPSDLQHASAKQWLNVIELEHLSKKPFYELSAGQQRMALIARAMIKHPPLLILDEAIAGLDDYNALLVIELIQKIANESESSILYVSHREETGLFPRNKFQLIPSQNGSTGKIIA